MKIKSVLLAGACLGIAAMAAAGGDADYIKASHDKFAKAALANNYKTMEKSILDGMTKDFKYKGAHGEVQNRDQWLATMKQEMASGFKFTKFKFEVGKISVKGKTATVQSKLSVAATGPGPDKKVHTFASVGESVETWVKEGSKWKVKMIETKKETSTLDGKPFDPTKMGGGG